MTKSTTGKRKNGEKLWRVQAILSHVEFVDVWAKNAEEAEEKAKDTDNWTALEPGDFEVDDVSEIEPQTN
jgi:hypothetical protein